MKKGVVLLDDNDNANYRIISITETNGVKTGGSVAYVRPSNKKCKTATVKPTVKINGVVFSHKEILGEKGPVEKLKNQQELKNHRK